MAYQRSFLKWAGSKYQLLAPILAHLPPGKRLLEPFAGSGVVFLNTNYPRYLLNDINADLIGIYQCLKQHGQSFIHDVKAFFTPENNTKERYLELRQRFNLSSDRYERALLFIYLNRHGFNGLCRYSRQGFNVPFGRHYSTRFPEKAMMLFYQKLQKTVLHHKHYSDIFRLANPGDVIYCDPPYIVNHPSSAFHYFGIPFTLTDQQQLAALALEKQHQGVTVLISNHATNITKQLYQHAKTIHLLQAYRSMNRYPAERRMVEELLAVYSIEQ